MVRLFEASKRNRDENPLLAERRQASVSFYARHILSQAPGLADAVLDGSSVIAETRIEAL